MSWALQCLMIPMPAEGNWIGCSRGLRGSMCSILVAAMDAWRELLAETRRGMLPLTVIRWPSSDAKHVAQARRLLWPTCAACRKVSGPLIW